MNSYITEEYEVQILKENVCKISVLHFQTPWSRVLEKLIVAELVKIIFSPFM
jgi:hypothetical protein